MLTRDDLLRESASTGFQPEALEKVVRLFELLEALTNKETPFMRRLVEANLVLEGAIEEPVLVDALPQFKAVVKRLKLDNDATRARLKSDKQRAR